MADPLLKHMTSQDIDDILDEIGKTEDDNNDINKIQKESISKNINWDKISSKMREGNINFIKNLITSKEIDINAQNPSNGLTLLHYAIIRGNYDLVKAICNFGADVKIEDNSGDDALKIAIKFGRYKITELIFYRQLSGSLGNDLRDIATKIHLKNKEAQEMANFAVPKGDSFFDRDQVKYELSIQITKFMVKMVKERKPFGPDLLFYAYYLMKYEIESNRGITYMKQDGTVDEEKCPKEPLKSLLWKQLMKTYEEILSDTSDKKGWEWLKTYILPSLVWFLPHPKNSKTKKIKKEWMNDVSESEDEDISTLDDMDNMESVLKKTLFWELLVRVKNESKKQSNLLLKDKIDSIKMEKPNEWKQLISYNVNTKWSKNARQDICGCIVPKYNEYDLSEAKYPPSTHFSAKKHYDTNIYLNELLFRANIMDDLFQRNMKLITKEISDKMGDNTITYRAGPVKTLTRSQTKVENDYINEDYPTSAKILDINRCALQFHSIKSMMTFIQIFTDKIKNGKARSLVSIIRCKNGWSVYDPQYPQYTDIKLNVLMEVKEIGSIIIEIQFLLSLMSAFKKKAHKLYSVERKFELVYNFGALRKQMNGFKDYADIHSLVDGLLKDSEGLRYFKLFLSSIYDSTTDPSNIWSFKSKQHLKENAILNIMFHRNQDINSFFFKNYNKFYMQSIVEYISSFKKINGSKTRFKDILETVLQCKGGNRFAANKFIETLLKMSRNEFIKLLKLSECTGGAGSISFNLFTDIYGLEIESDRYSDRELILKCTKNDVLKTRIINDKEKKKLLLHTAALSATLREHDCKSPASHFIEYFKNDRKQLFKLFMSEKENIMEVLVGRYYHTESINILKWVLYDSILHESDKSVLFSRHKTIFGVGVDPFCYSIIENKWDITILILEYYKNNTNKLYQLLQDHNYHKEEHDKTIPVLTVLSRSKNIVSTYILEFILFQTKLSYQQKWELFSLSHPDSPCSLITSNENNFLMILDYFDPQRIKQNEIKKWFDPSAFTYSIDQHKLSGSVMLHLLKYFVKDRKFISELLLFKELINDDVKGEFDESLEFILNGSEWNIANLYDMIDKNIEDAADYSTHKILCILKRFKNNKEMLYKLMKRKVRTLYVLKKDYTYSKQLWFKLLQCMGKNTNMIIELLQLICNNKALTDKDRDELFFETEDNKSSQSVKKQKVKNDDDKSYDNYAIIKSQIMCSAFHSIWNKCDINKIFEIPYFNKSTTWNLIINEIEKFRSFYQNQEGKTRANLFRNISWNDLEKIKSIQSLKAVKGTQDWKLQKQIANYIQFVQDLLNENEIEEKTFNIDIDDNKDNDNDKYQSPLITACIFGKYELIQLFYKKYGEKLKENTIKTILFMPNINNILYINDEMKNKILVLLVLNNEHLSNTQKYKVLTDSTKLDDDNDKIEEKTLDLNLWKWIKTKSFMKLLSIFENHLKEFEEIIFSFLNKPINEQLIDENIIDFILNSNLSLEIKIKWIKLMISNISRKVLIKSGVLIQILEFIKNDNKLLLDILLSTHSDQESLQKQEVKNDDDESDDDYNYGMSSYYGQSAEDKKDNKDIAHKLLYDILCDEKFKDDVINDDILQKYIINNDKLSNVDKLKLFKSEYNGKSILYKGCNKYCYFEQIFNFLKNNDKQSLIEILASSEIFIIQSIENKPNEMEIILKFINNLNNEQQIKILNKQNKHRFSRNCLFEMKGFNMITKILSMVNEKIISELLMLKAQDSETKWKDSLYQHTVKQNGETAYQYTVKRTLENSKCFDDGIRWILLTEYNKYIKLNNKKKKQSFQQFVAKLQVLYKYLF